MTRAPGWLPDPTGRHEMRYWDGDLWTADVSNGGAVSFDPLEVPVTPPPSGTTWPASATTSDPPGPAAGTSTQQAAGPEGPMASFPSRVGGPDPVASFPTRSGVAGTGGGSPSRPGASEPPGRARPGRGGADPSAPARPAGIDPAARFPPRASNADPMAPVGPSPRRSWRRVLLGVGLLAVAAGIAAAVVLVAGSDDEDGTSSSAAGRSRPRGSGSAETTTTSAPTSSDPSDVMVTAVADGIVEGSGGAIEQSEAECMGRALIDEIGIDRLEEVTEATAGEAGANPLDMLTDAEQMGAMTRMRACVDQATLDSLAPQGE